MYAGLPKQSLPSTGEWSSHIALYRLYSATGRWNWLRDMAEIWMGTRSRNRLDDQLLTFHVWPCPMCGGTHMPIHMPIPRRLTALAAMVEQTAAAASLSPSKSKCLGPTHPSPQQLCTGFHLWACPLATMAASLLSRSAQSGFFVKRGHRCGKNLGQVWRGLRRCGPRLRADRELHNGPDMDADVDRVGQVPSESCTDVNGPCQS